jgi:hypothetical protein
VDAHDRDGPQVVTARGRVPRRVARTGNGPRGAVAGTLALLVLFAAAGCGGRAAITAGGSTAVRGGGTAADGRLVPLCTDAAGDGGSADLLSAATGYGQDQAFLVFSFATAVPSGAATVTLASATGQRRVRIGLRDDRPVSVVMETADSTATAAHPDEVVHVAETEVHVVLPAVTVPPQAHDWQVTVTAGTTRDICRPA